LVDDDGFILVKRKNHNTHKNPIQEIQSILTPLDKSDAYEIIIQVCRPYHPAGIFVFGSYARNQPNPNDIDILILWNRNAKMKIPENIGEIKNTLEIELGFSVDLISMIYTKEFVNFEPICQCFIEENVMNDAIPLLPNTHKDMILQSLFIGKCY
jgi:predicted nucleotidyltransferase